MKVMSFAALVCAAACTLFAQEYRGTISGAVTDPQGGAIAKAKIVVLETRTGVKATVESESSGNYTIPFLQPGEYQVSAELAGFKKFVQSGITLSAGAHPVIDIRLEVGAVSESVTVEADAPLVVSSNASVGQVITTAEVEDFPINGRTPMMLAHMALGVISTFEPGPVRPFDNGSGNSMSVGGAPSGTNEVLLNGSPNAGFQKQMAYSPSQDAVAEVRVNAFEGDAAYGHSGGGTVNLITRSGTNALHGSAYEFNQVSTLDANNFFFNRTGTSRPAYHYNQYGVTVGGPLYLPKIFNGKNRVFWFFAWEGLRDSDPANSPIETGSPVNFATLPTDAERKGDLSALLKANKPGTDYTIYDPNTGVVSGTTVARTPFAGNIIPANRLNPISQNIMKLYPQPNATGDINGFRNYIVNAIDSDSYDNELGRLDVNVSQKQKLSFDMRHNYRAQDKNNYFRNIGTGTFLYRINQGASLDDIYTISPSVFMDVRANWTRYQENRGMPNDGIDLTSLGFPAYIAAASPAAQLPQITFTSTSVSAGSQSSFQSLSGNGDGTNSYDSIQLFGSVVKIWGKHNTKVGADLREYRWSVYSHGNSSGAYTFNSNWTKGPLQTSTAAPLGQDLAAFLLGLPASGSFDLNAQSTSKSRYGAIFVQDDWRVKNNLTINLGLRWEHESPTTERYNRAINGFDGTAVNSISAAAAAAYAASPIPQLPAAQFKALGGYTFASNGDPNLYHTHSSIFSPRVGFAWTPTRFKGKTVIRGGYGVFVSPLEIIGNGSSSAAQSLNQAGFSQTTQLSATGNNFLSPSATFSDPFPSGFVRPSGNTLGASTFLGQGISYFNPDARDGYSQRWTFGIQQQLPYKVVLEVAYIGNHSVHMPITTNMDYIPRQFLSTSPVRDDAVINALGATVTNPFKGLLPNSSNLNGNTVAASALLTPYPEFSAVSLLFNPAGSSFYHSLNVRLQKRLTNGLTFINNFIYGKLIEQASYLNDSDSAPHKRIANDSRPLRNVVASTYELPFGKGKRFDMHHWLVNGAFGGWKLNGTLTLQSGSLIGGWGDVIYYGGPLNLNNHQPDGLAFDTTRFNTVTNQQPSSHIRTFDTQFNNIRRDMVKNLDTSLSKNFGFGEKRYLQMRFEAFNATNRVTFGNPNITPTSTSFGQITTQVNTPRRVQLGARVVW